MSEKPTGRGSAPDCLKCAHYFITHDVGFPYGCRAMNFKSRRRPQREVELASNEACLSFLPKAGATAPRPSGSDRRDMTTE